MSFSGSEADVLFVNDGSGTFVDCAYLARLDDRGDGRSAVFADLDGDGDLDLVLRSLQSQKIAVMRNDLHGGARALRVRLQGTRSNRDGIGAMVRVQAVGRWQVRRVRAGHGYLGQGPAEAWFGLAGRAAADRVEVTWPSGTAQRFGPVPAGHRLTVVEGADAPSIEPFTRLAIGPPAPPPLGLGSLAAEADSGDALASASRSPGAVVVNLWAPWCRACAAEAPVLEAAARRCADVARFVALSVEPDPERTRAGAEALGIRLPVSIARPGQLAILDAALDRIALPATLAFDRRGHIRGATLGVASEQRLLELAVCGEPPASAPDAGPYRAGAIDADRFGRDTPRAGAPGE